MSPPAFRKGARTMCDKSVKPLEGGPPDRRRFLKVSAAAAVVGLLGGSLGGRLAYADALTKERQRIGRERGRPLFLATTRPFPRRRFGLGGAVGSASSKQEVPEIAADQ